MLSGIAAILLFMVGPSQFNEETHIDTACSEPLTFHVDKIDERFSITKEEVKNLMVEVAQIWSNAVETTIIEYDEKGEISLNLIYEEEQQLTDRERQFRDRLENEELSIIVLENEYTRLNEEYESEVEQYDKDSRELQGTIDRMNEWVRKKNKNEGFNQEGLKRFERRHTAIDQVKMNLNQREQMLKRKAAELNNKISLLNEKIKNKNLLVDEYNREFTGTRKFTQGAYEWTRNNRMINIYHFLDKYELKFVIAQRWVMH